MGGLAKESSDLGCLDYQFRNVVRLSAFQTLDYLRSNLHVLYVWLIADDRRRLLNLFSHVRA